MAHLDPLQLPAASKGKPWSAIQAHDFLRRVDLIVPQDSYDLVQEVLETACPPFCRVDMSLLQLLQGDFFSEYIKIGDVMMLSKGRRDIDNVLQLKDGKLTMFLDRETYERAGLVGKPYGSKGNRGLKPRWVVEYDLRSPSMFSGKKGFDRLLNACKTTLCGTFTWLFCNVSRKIPSPDPLDAYQPIRCETTRDIFESINVILPSLKPSMARDTTLDLDDVPDSLADTYEWLSLVRLQSPRLLSTDTIDPFLSRYSVPGNPEEQTATRLCRVCWEGFFSPDFARQVLVNVLLKLPSRTWFSLSAASFSQTMCGEVTESTFLRLPELPQEYLLWQIRSHE
ncbi:ribonuclease P 40kDa subunit [Coniella lustricola]|uniref:Ribonuclease P 40kDa subunit n=1 Tax=Coniella lustricola TaxID=2025994 RepID=A0A2T3ACZ2_9PEZI|nr:ribonuclease P 40kDa subunit [Coniella lustricola]